MWCQALGWLAWDGKRWDEIAASDAARYRHWAENWVIQEAPGGESFADLIRRTGAWFSALLGSTQPDDCVLAVAHAGSIRVKHTLRPLGVAMAGRDVHDPYKD